jgi:hypothetical protein
MKQVNVYKQERVCLGPEEGGRWGTFFTLVESFNLKRKRQQRAMLRRKRVEYGIDYNIGGQDDFENVVFIEKYPREFAQDSSIYYR